MKTLYIIGNGFDIHHELPTSYSCFHSFVKENHKELADDMENFFQFKLNSEYLWCDFENDLGTFDSSEFFNAYNEVDITSDSFKQSEVYGLEDEIDQLGEELINKIRDAFEGWISSLEFPEAQSVQAKLILLDRNSRFITFNYTDTLENLYSISPDQILYIHNRADGSEGPLIFGHSESVERYPKEDELDENGDSNRTLFTDAEDAARHAFYAFQKDTDAVLKEHVTFFNELKETTQVIVLGHSLGKADWPYFRKIREVAPMATWTFSYYSDWDLTNIPLTVAEMIGINPKDIKLIELVDLLQKV